MFLSWICRRSWSPCRHRRESYGTATLCQRTVRCTVCCPMVSWCRWRLGGTSLSTDSKVNTVKRDQEQVWSDICVCSSRSCHICGRWFKDWCGCVLGISFLNLQWFLPSDDLWKLAKNQQEYPFGHLLGEPGQYIFQGVTQDGVREDFYDETRRLCDLRLHEAYLKVREPHGNKDEKMFNQYLSKWNSMGDVDKWCWCVLLESF